MKATDLPDPLPLFDTHAHLNFKAFAKDLDEVLARAEAVGIRRIVTIGAGGGLANNRSAIALAERFDHLFATVGIHPHRASTLDDATFAEIVAMAQHPRVVAIGETGLDYFYEHSPRAVQQAAFARFIELSQDLGKPVIVHTRDAEDDTIATMRAAHAERCDGIIHCFSGTQRLANYALELGFYLSFSGIVTFPTASVVQEVARTCPLDRILVETDAPYLAPIPLRGKRNEPAFVNYTARFIAKLRGISAEELAEATFANSCRIYDIADE